MLFNYFYFHNNYLFSKSFDEFHQIGQKFPPPGARVPAPAPLQDGLGLGDAGVPRPVHRGGVAAAGVLASQQEAGQLGAGQRGQQRSPVTHCLAHTGVAVPALQNRLRIITVDIFCTIENIFSLLTCVWGSRVHLCLMTVSGASTIVPRALVSSLATPSANSPSSSESVTWAP